MVFPLLAAVRPPEPTPPGALGRRSGTPRRSRQHQAGAARIPPGAQVTTVSSVAAPPGIWGLGGAGVADPAALCGAGRPSRRSRSIPARHFGIRCRRHRVRGGGRSAYGPAGAGSVPGRPVPAVEHDRAGAPARVSIWSTRPASMAPKPWAWPPKSRHRSRAAMKSVRGQAPSPPIWATTMRSPRVISDPGSPDAALTPQFAADLLVKTVSALRG